MLSVSPPADFAAIQAALERLHTQLGGSYRATPAGMWACSSSEEVYDLLGQLDLSRYRHFADLGSGDGRAVLLASLFLPATGIEADPGLVEASRDTARRLGLKRASFICADCRQVDLSAYDLLFIYPDKPLDWLTKMLPASWQGRLVVYGSYFRPQGLKQVRTLQAGQSKCTLWET